MSANMKEVKLRIKSVQNTMQITRAMELVAASKLRRAQEQVHTCHLISRSFMKPYGRLPQEIRILPLLM